MLDNDRQLRAEHAPLSRFIEGAIRETVPLFPPGTRFHYQSMGTLVVAEIIQRIAGQSIHDYLQRQIFEPLGLVATRLGSQGLDEHRIVEVLQRADFQPTLGRIDQAKRLQSALITEALSGRLTADRRT